MKVVLFYNEHGSPTMEPYYYMYEENGIELIRVKEGCTEDETIDACRGADAIVTSTHPFTASVIRRLDKSVKAIVRAAMGYEIIDIHAANDKGIYVCNVPDYAIEEVSIHQTALILACIRKIVFYDRKVRSGAYDHVGYYEGYPARRVSGMKLGLLGFGRIAKLVARYFIAMGMEVFAYDPLLPESVFEEHGVNRCVAKDEIFESCDVITPNIPLTDSSFHIIDAEAISKMKHGVILVNTGRGPIIDQNALIEGLNNGIIRAAGLDVFEEEPLPMNSPLISMENVVLTPHIAYNSEESFMELQRKTVEYSIAGAKGEVPIGAVNKEIR